jgi:hypothetical protein
LGAILTRLYLQFEETEAALGLPPNVHSYALLPIGYPMGASRLRNLPSTQRGLVSHTRTRGAQAFIPEGFGSSVLVCRKYRYCCAVGIKTNWLRRWLPSDHGAWDRRSSQEAKPGEAEAHWAWYSPRFADDDVETAAFRHVAQRCRRTVHHRTGEDTRLRELLCAYLARELKRPVKWWESRSESHQATSHGQAHTELIEVAFRNDGRMLAMKAGEIQEARSRKDGIELGRSYFDAP